MLEQVLLEQDLSHVGVGDPQLEPQALATVVELDSLPECETDCLIIDAFKSEHDKAEERIPDTLF
ncbi:hypothetical protein DV711_10295 [Motiliproteus coralliicola]|uniref:Uncharacterized protein n=1 Tax=Motiliproteus coralliicola TaxID=2283196 RepID=A0A369WQP1_9GAMM|nr:hypothetical protein [Motiliproteus coralliicola]RDE22934.1 hypothetical protein DV711_10295 [Motiliproteus coralliicola]